MPKVQWWDAKKNPYGLSEISQSTGMLFSFVSSPKEGFQQCHPFVKCRDFLHDGLRAYITGKPCGIYGYNYNKSKNPPIDLSRTRMLVTKLGLSKFTGNGSYDKSGEGVFEKKMENGLALLHHYEDIAGVRPRSRSVKIYDNNNRPVWVFTSSNFWQKAPYLISMYTFLIRLGDKLIKFDDTKSLVTALEKESKKGGDNDRGYLTKSWDKMHLIMEKYEELFDDEKDLFDPSIDINTYHNRAGIRSLCQGASATNKMNKKFAEIIGGKK